ncbi:MAG TPA: hypothetical protein VKO62_06520, partial [Solirubrobacterales bacterium]|nr:hypothetical protein [Solirubrobacterales bacterium]
DSSPAGNNGTLSGATCANHDDFRVTRASVSLTLGTSGTVTAGPTYLVTTATSAAVTREATTAASLALGDGTCGANKEAEFHFDVADAPTTRTVDTLGAGTDAHSFWLLVIVIATAAPIAVMAAVRLLPSDQPERGRHRRRIPLPSEQLSGSPPARGYEVAR